MIDDEGTDRWTDREAGQPGLPPPRHLPSSTGPRRPSARPSVTPQSPECRGRTVGIDGSDPDCCARGAGTTIWIDNGGCHWEPR